MGILISASLLTTIVLMVLEVICQSEWGIGAVIRAQADNDGTIRATLRTMNNGNHAKTIRLRTRYTHTHTYRFYWPLDFYTLKLFFKRSFQEESNFPWSFELKEFNVPSKHTVTFSTQFFLRTLLKRSDIRHVRPPTCTVRCSETFSIQSRWGNKEQVL